MADTDMAQVMDAVQDADFPATKDQLVAVAQAADARDQVLQALQALPPVEYDNREDVAHSVRLPVDSDLDHSKAQRNDQLRGGGKHGLSGHLRDVPKPPVEEELSRRPRSSGGEP